AQEGQRRAQAGHRLSRSPRQGYRSADCGYRTIVLRRRYLLCPLPRPSAGAGLEAGPSTYVAKLGGYMASGVGANTRCAPALARRSRSASIVRGSAEIFVRAELCGVDENRDDDEIAFLYGFVDQARVPSMQGCSTRRACCVGSRSATWSCNPRPWAT